jgi:hypothetical protein
VAVAITQVGPGSGAALAVVTNLCHNFFALATPTLPTMMGEHNYGDVRGEAFLAQARRERRPYPSRVYGNQSITPGFFS